MRTWQWWLMAALVIGLVSAGAALSRLSSDKSDFARRARMRLLGVVALGALVPVNFFLEDRLSALPYISLMVLLCVLGVSLYVRGGGWKEFP
jgi:hypothetical protein